MKIELEPVGIIRTPHKSQEGMPIQPLGAEGMEGRIELNPEMKDGLKDIERFSHIILIYYFHESSGCILIQKPFMSETPRGVFSIRSPKRPNPIGLSIVKLIRVEDNIVYFERPDQLDGTPLLDIKPYVPELDSFEDASRGWLKNKAQDFRHKLSDDRFTKD